MYKDYIDSTVYDKLHKAAELQKITHPFVGLSADKLKELARLFGKRIAAQTNNIFRRLYAGCSRTVGRATFYILTRNKPAAI
ncbi:hypothetical protein ACTJKN_05355 [Pedobacter sp. 22163]|uniref:hypothetical protein n=1 Tax=Pedobacter sp. 22163 TaxID=3453883 RepID=UPI003F826700